MLVDFFDISTPVDYGTISADANDLWEKGYLRVYFSNYNTRRAYIYHEPTLNQRGPNGYYEIYDAQSNNYFNGYIYYPFDLGHYIEFRVFEKSLPSYPTGQFIINNINTTGKYFF